MALLVRTCENLASTITSVKRSVTAAAANITTLKTIEIYVKTKNYLSR